MVRFNVLRVCVYNNAERTFPPLLPPDEELILWLCVL